MSHITDPARAPQLPSSATLAGMSRTSDLTALQRVANELSCLLPYGFAFQRRLEKYLRDTAGDPNAVLFTSFKDAASPVMQWGEHYVLLFWTPSAEYYEMATAFTSLDVLDSPSESHVEAVAEMFKGIMVSLKMHLQQTNSLVDTFGLPHLNKRSTPAVTATGLTVESFHCDFMTLQRKDVVTRTSDVELPAGLVFDKVRADDLHEVIEHNEAAKTTDEMARLPSLGIRNMQTDTLVGWAFYSLYGTIRAVHTQPEWRGQGLARKLVARIISPQPSARTATGEQLPTDTLPPAQWIGWTVFADNEPSKRLFRSFGGQRAYISSWLDVHLDRCPLPNPHDRSLAR